MAPRIRPHLEGESPLETYKRQKALTDDQLANLLELNRTQVVRLRSGKRKPSLSTALKIKRNTGGDIPVEAWGSDV